MTTDAFEMAVVHRLFRSEKRLWHARIPLHSDTIQRMQSEHAFIAKSVAIVELLLADWVAATEAHTSELATQSRATDLLVAEIKTLTQLVGAVTEQGAAFIGTIFGSRSHSSAWPFRNARPTSAGDFLAACRHHKGCWCGFCLASGGRLSRPARAVDDTG
jgi:hypothetical protein